MGCSHRLVERVFLKPPAYHQGATANIDRNLRNLASDFGLTDMNNQNGTAAATRIDWRKQREQEMLAGQTFSLALDQGKNAVSTAMGQIGATPDGSIAQTLAHAKESLPPPRINVQGRYKPERMPEAPA